MKKLLTIILFLFVFSKEVSASRETANQYILMDQTTGRIIEGKNYNQKALIASITKIMTATLAIESGKLENTVTVDETILKSYGSGVYIEIGEELTLKDLIYGLMLRSGNDAALMIAKYVGGEVETFVEQMNTKAQEIGMTKTTFTNPSGLDNDDTGNYSTAYDMALLTKYAMQYKEYQEIVKTKSYTLKTNKKTYIWKNKNKLLKYNYITGGKTGYTEKARRTLVSTATKNHINLIAVTINDSDDWNTHKNLYEETFQNYIAYKFLNCKNFTVPTDTYYQNNLYIKKDVYIPIKQAEISSMYSKIKLEKKEKYQKDDKVGEYQIYLNKAKIYSEPIYVKSSQTTKKQPLTILKKIKEKFK